MGISRLLSKFAPSIKSSNSLFSGLSLGGVLDTGSTGQIKFPTTKNPSNDPNTLDDYEEGTFTAYFAGNVSGTPMFGPNGYPNIYGLISNFPNGWYTKLGNLVSVSCYIQMAPNFSFVNGYGPNSHACIAGLPFASPSVVTGGGG